MPTFTSYPALQARAPDVWGAMQRGAEGAQINQLRQMKIDQAMNPQANPRMALDREKFEFSKDKDQRAQALEKVQQISGLLAPFADPAMPEIQKAQMWPQMLQRAQQMGLPIDKAPPQYDPQWVAMTMGQAGQYVSQAKDAAKNFTLSPGQTRYGPSGEAIASLPKAGVEDAPQYGTPKFDEKVGKFYQINPKTNKREYITPQSGMSLTIGEDGTVTFTQGAGGGMEKKTRGNLEKSLVAAREGLARLKDIQSKYRPEFQEIPTRLGVAWTGLKARFGSADVSSEDRRALTEFADYRRTALSNVNLYIKEITGAQMSVQEAARIRKALPDPGEGIFGGDDPITFKAHMDSVMADLEKSVVRFNHYLSKGITDDEEIARLSPLDGMRIIANDETGERFVEVDKQWVPM